MTLAASIISCLIVFLAGELTPPIVSGNELNQIYPEDVEEMDITWQLAMFAFRASNFTTRTSRNLWAK
ncbi:hypothetical protein Hanom_Chr10g00905181 [Helianthus anomalus]